MRLSTVAYLTALATAGTVLSCPKLCRAVELDAGSYVVLSSPSANPFASETLVDTITSSPFQVYETDYSVPFNQWGSTAPQYLAATGSLTTSVYRATDGTYDFSYTVSSQYNAQPFAGPPYNVVAIPNLMLGGMGGVATDVSANRVPNTGTVGNHYLSVIRSADGTTADVSFTDAAVPIEHTPHYYSLMAGAAPVTVYLQTDAKAYLSGSASLAVQSYDARYEQSGPALSFVMDSFTPVASVGNSQPPVVPEPLTMALLSLALMGLGWRMRRRG